MLLTFFASVLLTKVLISFLNKKNIMDTPNKRSFHKKPTPIGGGWAIILTTLPIIIAFSIYQGIFLNTIPLIIGALILITVSWKDDTKSINPFIKLPCQIVAIMIAMNFLPEGPIFFNGLLPIWIERICIFFAWLWFTNLYNFMDGIDGITGSETACICTGILLLSFLIFIPTNILLLSSILLGASLGFLLFNWQPAKIFPGDIGAIFLGYTIAYILLSLAIEGHIIIAIILPLYYLMDATIVILKRLIKKEKIWQAHQQQYFHKSVKEMNRSHYMTTTIIIICNLCLISLAMLSVATNYEILCLTISVILTYGFMLYIANKKYTLDKQKTSR
jgi:UDP-N-acetylmuramyl pentapeptide phosphotransferase/UDP-N-acetylglucosamine-1-phosphate transferase